MYIINDKRVWIGKHAVDGMNAERPPIHISEILDTIEFPDKTETESGGRKKTMKWIDTRTIIIYYEEDEEDIYVKGASATRKKIR